MKVLISFLCGAAMSAGVDVMFFDSKVAAPAWLIQLAQTLDPWGLPIIGIAVILSAWFCHSRPRRWVGSLTFVAGMWTLGLTMMVFRANLPAEYPFEFGLHIVDHLGMGVVLGAAEYLTSGGWLRIAVRKKAKRMLA